jgi:hypothetical protein
LLIPLISQFDADVNSQIFIKNKNTIILFYSDEDKTAEFKKIFEKAALQLN